MTSKDKLLSKFLRQPESFKYRDIEQILLYLGFIKTFGKGSHVHFGHPLLNFKIIIPIHNYECKKYYKKRVSKDIRRLIGEAKKPDNETI